MRLNSLTRSILILATLILISVLAAGEESIYKVFPGNPGGKLTLKMENGGSARVISWDQEIIGVTYEDTRIGLDVWNMSFDASGGNLSIIATLDDPQLDSGGLHFMIKVPREFNLNINSGGGNVTIEGADGTIIAHTAGGLAHLNNVSGSAQVSTGGGNIKITESRLTGSATAGGGNIFVNLESGWMDVETGAGDVTVEIEQIEMIPSRNTLIRSGLGDVTLTVPENYPMNLSIDLAYTQRATRSYKINSDFDITQSETPEWDYSVNRDNPVKHINGSGRINGGSRTYQISTMNGNVRVKKLR